MNYSSTQIKHTFNSYNGGYIAYFKLLFIGNHSLFLQYSMIWSSLSFGQKIGLILNTSLKLPWWLFIKPIGKVFSKKTFYKGNYSQYSNVIEYNIRKNITWKIIGIPYFFWTSKTLSNEDIERIAKVNPEHYNIKKMGKLSMPFGGRSAFQY